MQLHINGIEFTQYLYTKIINTIQCFAIKTSFNLWKLEFGGKYLFSMCWYMFLITFLRSVFLGMLSLWYFSKFVSIYIQGGDNINSLINSLTVVKI